MPRRKPVAPQARYDAAGTGRRIASWSPPSSGPNQAITGLQKIRDRARDSTRNDWAASSSIQKWATNLVGVGITPRWKNKKFTDLWAKHVKTADADCVLDAYGQQTLAARTWFDGGEVFLRRRPRNPSPRLAVPVQYQLIEPDYCPIFDADQWTGMPAGNQIRQGIELDRYGTRVAFWFYKDHPGDKPMRLDPQLLVRVAASQVSHVFEPKRPGQMRGVSELSSVLVRLRNSADFEDTVLDRQKLANLFVMFITKQMPDLADIDFDPATGLPKFYNNDGTPMARLESGMSQELAPGENVTFSNPPEAGTTYSDYMRSTHLGTAAGSGLPYELMSGDIQNISDRALRVLLLEFRRLARQRQWQILIPMHCQKTVDWWAEAAVLDGSITLAELDEAKSPTWSPEGWEYIHPVQDPQGKKIEIEMGTRSRSSVIAERGDDPATVDEERAADKKREDKLGLVPPPPEPAAKPGARPQPNAVEESQIHAFNAQARHFSVLAAKAEAPESDEPSAIEHFVAGLSSLATAVVALASREQAPIIVPAANVTNEFTVPVPSVTNEVTVPPAVVNNEITVPVGSCEGWVIKGPTTEMTPAATMTAWLHDGGPDWEEFDLGRDATLKANDEIRTQVAYTSAMLAETAAAARSALRWADGSTPVLRCLQQLKGWLHGRGVHLDSMDEDAIEEALKWNLPPEARRALEIRAAVGSASVKKVFAMRNQATRAGRLHDLYTYHGARTGRPTGNGPQPTNLPKAGPHVYRCGYEFLEGKDTLLPGGGCGRHHGAHTMWCHWCGKVTVRGPKASREWNPDAVDDALEAIGHRSLEWLQILFGDAMLTIAGVLRGLFIAAPGHDLISSDFSAIEGVVIAALAGEKWRLDVFAGHGKIYEMSAAKILGISFEDTCVASRLPRGAGPGPRRS